MAEYDAKGSEPYTREWWLRKLKAEEKAHERFRKQADDAWKDFEGDGQDEWFPIFWANVETMHSAVYARQPKPDVRRRYNDADEQMAPKPLATAIERALEYTLDTQPVDANANRAVDDFIVAALGQCRVRYEARTIEEPVMGLDGVQLLDDKTGEPATTKRIVMQEVGLDLIPSNRFRWEPCPSWEQSDWSGVDHYFDRLEIKERFGVEVEGGTGPNSGKPDSPNEAKYETQYLVHEIWCRKTRKVHWIGATVDEIDETLDDPLGLKDFYPWPRPMVLNIARSSFVPRSDYSKIRRLCRFANSAMARISALVDQIKDVGVYDAAWGTEVSKIMGGKDGTRVPIDNLIGKLKGQPNFDAVLLTPDHRSKVATIASLVDQLNRCQQLIEQLTGMSDITRGSTQASETATAQEIKGRWANIRLARKQETVAKWFRDVFRIMAEIVSEHFEAAQIALMTGVQLDENMMAILRSDVGRQFAIDVETDSTIATDEAAERENATEVVSTVLSNWQALSVLPGDFQKELLKLMTGPMKLGRTLDGAIDALPGTQQQMQQVQQQNQQLQQQVADLTKQLQAFQQGKEQRENADTAADVAKKGAETQHTQAETQKLVLETQQAAMAPVGVVLQ